MKYTLHENRLNIVIDQPTELNKLADKLCLSRKTKYLLVSGKKLLLNGEPVRTLEMPLKENDTVTFISEPQPIDYAPADKPCSVIYEDDLVFVASKPAGIIVHDQQNSLANQAARYLIDHDLHCPVRYIHRLDRETSGLILFSKFPLLQAYYDQQLAERKITRKYLAIAKGNLPVGRKMTFNDPIGADRHQNNVFRVSKTGQKAVTEVTVLNSFDGLVLLECRLLTGRTHQIRVHLSHHNLPIVNDAVYGVPDTRLKNMGLWAYRLSFTDPITGKKITVRDRMNPDFKPYMKKSSHF